ncbi:MAG: recombination-associated protein RdgC [Verrucomicrobiota bacterium]
MSFESGSVAFRMFYLAHPLPQDAVERFAKHAAPPLKSIGIEVAQGWVGGRHLLDVPITEDNAIYAGYLRLVLLKAERKVPTSLLRAECMLEEVAYMRAENKPFVDRKTRSEIRKQILSRLLPDMPPTLKGIPFVYDARARLVYAGALSESQTDVFTFHFHNTTGIKLIPVGVATAAAERQRVDVRDWARTSFSPEVMDEEMEDAPGLDFLTWVWFVSEARGGIFKSKEFGDVGVALEGPLLFTRAGAGAHEITLRKGLPTVSAEAKTALLSGKKLRRAKLLIARADEAWSVSFDTELFVFRSLKMPEPKEVLEPVSRFQDRLLKLDAFRCILLELFDRFLAERSDAKKWNAAQKEIHQWAADRSTRR